MLSDFLQIKRKNLKLSEYKSLYGIPKQCVGKNLQQMKVAEKNMKPTPLLWSEDMKKNCRLSVK